MKSAQPAVSPRHRNYSLRQKVIVFVLVMILLPSLLIWAFSNFVFIRINEDTARRNMVSALQQTEIILRSNISNAQTYCEFIAFDPTLVSYLRKARYGWLSKAEVIDCLTYMTHMIDNLHNMDSRLNFMLYLDQPVLLTGERVKFFPFNQIPQDIMGVFSGGEIRGILPPVTRPVFPLRERNLYTVLQSVNGIPWGQDPLGLVVASIDASVLEQILFDLEIKYNATVFVHDGSQAFLKRADSNEQLISYAMEDINRLDQPTLSFAGDDYLVISETIHDVGWTLITLVSRQVVLQSSYQTATLSLVFSLFFAFLAVSVALLYFSRMTRRLGELSDHLKFVESGDYGRQIELSGDREIRSLQSSFNSMSGTIRDLINERYRTQVLLQYSELKALENQIKPHFLYNIMDVIKFKALRAGAGEVVRQVEILARFFRSTLGTGNRIISLDEEVRHIELYMQLQNFRYDNSITFIKDIPGKLATIPMLRFILQPLVENAIIHGIQQKPDHKGTVTVSASCTDDTLRIRVTDDGIGMPEEIRSSVLTAKGRGYGVQNVHHRIQVFYGENYGLNYLYSNASGTCVEIVLPVDYSTFESE
ncbi:MAG: histidine kinase [Bacillota bacterium]|nr:histidine kinase [Bacillota bacterium]